ncbi:PREDICTED: FGFR1 oncogene partner 2 homolog isoform X2 [Eufriesea mexicana]|nr:PREDICTED: FGFR1 oncogene partner 2 homolog isoform X2 [Eufriesea mexicana]XP_017763600.1 PREDICTED: FGFR1 oncogene partner 2 homolog isoform X2 [Eufriesea mexicana]XP_017763601.1 PREDICTED: FGFR1 oncogene partner 2 homolog isoform X2 [Eufriesea mexicana]
MSLTFQQIILDAKKLVIKISEHEDIADNLISEIESVCIQIANMKQYQEEVDILNTQAKHKPHIQLIAGIHGEIKHLQELQAENKELKKALEDHHHALELIMSKYRQHTASLLRLCKTDLPSLHNATYANLQIIINQAEKINEMAAVMKTAVAVDEKNEMKEKEMYSSLKEENTTLREIVNIANKYCSLNKDTKVESKTVQTDPIVY